MNKAPQLNEAIRANSLRVIGEDGRQLGVLTRSDAIEAAQTASLDLVVVSPDTNPPVARIVDWGKYNYQRIKQQKKNRSRAKPLEMKQMRLGLKIGDNDRQIKMRKVTEFLEAGHKVKITIIYRGRELAHKELGFKLAESIIDDFGEAIAVDQPPQFAGRQLNFVIRNKHAKAKNAQRNQEASSPDQEGQASA